MLRTRKRTKHIQINEIRQQVLLCTAKKKSDNYLIPELNLSSHISLILISCTENPPDMISFNMADSPDPITYSGEWLIRITDR